MKFLEVQSSSICSSLLPSHWVTSSYPDLLSYQLLLDVSALGSPELLKVSVSQAKVAFAHDYRLLLKSLLLGEGSHQWPQP